MLRAYVKVSNQYLLCIKTLHSFMPIVLVFSSQVNPSELDLCEDLSKLVSVNESSILHTLTSRAKVHMALTHAGPNLLALWPPLVPPGKVSFMFKPFSWRLYQNKTLI